MTLTWLRRRLRMTVGQRLFLTLLPSLLALALVVSLAYYGEYQRQAPGFIVTFAAVLATLSVIGTWFNSRYLASRIVRLAGNLPSQSSASSSTATHAVDELDRIEQVVDRMDSALVAREEERLRTEARVEAKLRDEATMLAAVVRDTMARLDEVRLPLHILLEARFGELNENQEELLATARDASVDMDQALRQLEQLANADRGALPVHHELVQVNDVMRAIAPLARMSAERRNARLSMDFEPGIPRLMSDRSRLAQAISLLATEATLTLAPETALRLSTERRNGWVHIVIAPAAHSTLAERLIGGLGGRVVQGDDHVAVQLPERQV